MPLNYINNDDDNDDDDYAKDSSGDGMQKFYASKTDGDEIKVLTMRSLVLSSYRKPLHRRWLSTLVLLCSLADGLWQRGNTEGALPTRVHVITSEHLLRSAEPSGGEVHQMT